MEQREVGEFGESSAIVMASVGKEAKKKYVGGWDTRPRQPVLRREGPWRWEDDGVKGGGGVRHALAAHDVMVPRG